MPDAVEVHGDQAAFMAADGQPAWHDLGTVVSQAVKAAEALGLAHLNGWEVHKVPVYGARRDKSGMAARTIVLPDTYMTVRTNPFTGEYEGLGTVGKLWTPFQNEELCDALDAIVDESGAHYHTAGSLEGGRKVFVSMKMPEGILVGGEDPVDMYLIASTAHDGTGATQFMISPVRPVCKNTLDAAVAAAKRRWSMRHTSGIEGKVQTAREELGMAWAYIETVEETFNKMIDAEFSKEQMETFLEKLMPDPKTDAEGWIERAAGQRGAVMDIFLNKETCEVGRGTKWAAYNAVAEYADWFRPGSPERRAREALGIGVNQAMKPKAFKALTVGLK
jgi:phage/plasmid-like protein (TIGR03299 family)